MEILLIAWFIFSPIACWIIANSKARLAGGWCIAGFFFGLFAVFIVAVLPSLARDKNAPTPGTHVRCPDCKELVRRDASICMHCRCKLVPQ